MKILLTNDDGVYSPGLETAAQVLSGAGHEVLVFAPDRERSACGHGMTLDRPLNIKDVNSELLHGDFTVKCCDGLPTDCVTLAIDVLGFEPDFLISGINKGPNLADDITYSGTVCAAMEGTIFNIQSMAVSLACGLRDPKIYFGTSADVMLALLPQIEKSLIPKGVLYNVNVPNLPFDELEGILITKKGVRRYRNRITVVKTPFISDRYWIGGHIDDEMEEGTDVWAVKHACVSITPLQMDMTAYSVIEAKKRGKDFFRLSVDN